MNAAIVELIGELSDCKWLHVLGSDAQICGIHDSWPPTLNHQNIIRVGECASRDVVRIQAFSAFDGSFFRQNFVAGI